MCPFQSSAVGVSTFITPGTLITPGSIVGTLSLVATPGLCGNYSLSDASGNPLVSGGGSFGSTQSQTFCINGVDLHGKVLQHFNRNANDLQKLNIDVSKLPKGMYWLQLVGNNGLVLSEPLVKQ